MESSESTSPDRLAAGVRSEVAGQEALPARRPHIFRRFAPVGGPPDFGYVERIESELVLLREENARLRFERAQPPGVGQTIERLKVLSGAQSPNEDHRDEAWHVLAEAMTLRQVLIDVCTEIGQTMITLQTRLNEVSLDLPNGSEPAADQRHASFASPLAQPTPTAPAHTGLNFIR